MTETQITARPVRLGTKLLMVMAAAVVAAGLCELLARMVFPAPPARARQPALLYQTDPELGFVHVAGQTGYLDDGLASINAMSLRGALPDAAPDADALRVLAIGDSTTFGWGVNDDETYCAALDRHLHEDAVARRPAVMNAGVVSYDLEQSVRFLRRLVPKVQPKVVIVGLFWNDLPYQKVSPDGVPQAVPDSAPPGATPDAARAAAEAPRVFRMANQPSRWNLLLRSSRMLYALRHAWLGLIAPTDAASNQVQWERALLEGRRTPAIDEAWRAIDATFAELRELANGAGFDVGVLTMPIRAQVEESYPNAEYQTRARAIAESKGFFVIDPLPLFREAGNPQALFIPYDRIHFSPQGNELIARAAYEALRERPEFRHAATR
jgi:lysophospholipase L1-like esterase